MARPVLATVDYFPHYTVHGKTMFTLESKFGLTGYAFWFKILELLGSSEHHYYDCNNSANWEYLLAKTSVSEDIANEIISLLARLEAINIELWQIKVIYSENFIENIKCVYNRRTIKLYTKDEIISYCMQKYPSMYSYCMQEPLPSIVNAELTPQSIVHKSIVHESIENTCCQNFNNFNNNCSEDYNLINSPSTKMTIEEGKVIFDEARKIYKGIKRGLDVEFNNYAYTSERNKTKETDWRETIYLLKPAIERLENYYKYLADTKQYVPPWKHFRTWINQRCWDTEYPEITDANKLASDPESNEVYKRLKNNMEII